MKIVLLCINVLSCSEICTQSVVVLSCSDICTQAVVVLSCSVVCKCIVDICTQAVVVLSCSDICTEAVMRKCIVLFRYSHTGSCARSQYQLGAVSAGS